MFLELLSEVSLADAALGERVEQNHNGPLYPPRLTLLNSLTVTLMFLEKLQGFLIRPRAQPEEPFMEVLLSGMSFA